MIWWGMVVLVQSRSHSSTQMSLAILTLIIPSALFGIIAGAYVDRWDKRLVLIWTNALRRVWPLPRAASAPPGTAPAVDSQSLPGLWQDIREVAHFLSTDRVLRLAVGHWTLGATLGLVIAELAPGFSENVVHVAARNSMFVL